MKYLIFSLLILFTSSCKTAQDCILFKFGLSKGNALHLQQWRIKKQKYMEMKTIDKQGVCPNCETNWSGEDIYQTMRNLNVFQNISDFELKKMAGYYGWTEEKPTKFSKAVVYTIQDTPYLVCPNMRCGHVFNSKTGEEYESMYDMKHKLSSLWIVDVPTIEPEATMINKYLAVVAENLECPISEPKALEDSESPFYEDGEQSLSGLGMSDEQLFKNKENPLTLAEAIKPYQELYDNAINELSKVMDNTCNRVKLNDEAIKSKSNGTDTRGSFSKLSKILRQGKGKTD